MEPRGVVRTFAEDKPPLRRNLPSDLIIPAPTMESYARLIEISVSPFRREVRFKYFSVIAPPTVYHAN
jgi:hypothetical protein